MSQMSLAVPMLTDEQRGNIHDSRSPYSAEDRVCAVMAYIINGGKGEPAAKLASTTIGQELKPGTLRQWKARAEWWAEADVRSRHPSKPTAWAMNRVRIGPVETERIRIVFEHDLPRFTGMTELMVWEGEP